MESQKKKVGNYLLVSKIGQGQFGVVYKGILIEDQSKVFAIKCITKSKLEGNSILNRLFQTEMNVMSKIDHPNVMHLYEFMETARNYYLVIQYCNNGDLESYLKKMGKLSEEEAVYFLMQIANGFQVLHKNKIMHRDVKLANLFLQDDQIVIGDFGFAKQGVDVTRTKLGTPITMAPELLTSTGSSYNSKADLWSIGVCFYQTLFGKTPFDAKSYDDLKEKVRTQSGNKLRFPKDVPISQECKHLLVHLLQYDPKKRLEWKDFFNHALFDLHAKNKPGFGNLTNSMLYRNHEDKVKKEFTKNKATAKDTNLIDPKQLEAGSLKKKKAEEENVDTVDTKMQEIAQRELHEEAFKYIRARYCHEKKKIIFVMYTVRKLRNLAKLRYLFEQLTNRFMFAACLLLKKGLLINENAINSLRVGYNTFDLKEFAKFLKTDDNTKIQKNFEDDHKIYKTFNAQMNTKFSDEVTSTDYKAQIGSFRNTTFQQIGVLDEEMDKHFRFFKDKLNFLNVSSDVESEYCLAVLHFYYSIFSEESFPFIKNGKIFDWKTFETENKAEHARKILKGL